MSTSVFIRLKDGRYMRYASGMERAKAKELIQELEQQLDRQGSVQARDPDGHIEDITPTRVATIDLLEDRP